MGCSPWGHKELDTTEHNHLFFQTRLIFLNHFFFQIFYCGKIHMT